MKFSHPSPRSLTHLLQKASTIAKSSKPTHSSKIFTIATWKSHNPSPLANPQPLLHSHHRINAHPIPCPQRNPLKPHPSSSSSALPATPPTPFLPLTHHPPQPKPSPYLTHYPQTSTSPSPCTLHPPAPPSLSLNLSSPQQHPQPPPLPTPISHTCSSSP